MSGGRFSRAAVRNDPFSGEAVPRLRRIDRDLDTVITDAQSRDWSADRPDRVVFARLAEARHQVRRAAGRKHARALIADPLATLSAVATWAVTVASVLVTGGMAMVRPLPLAATGIAGLWAAALVVTVVRLVRRHHDRHTTAGPAPVDDPYRYAAFRRRIESCAATARGHRARRRRHAAVDLEYALDWLAAAQTELPHR